MKGMKSVRKNSKTMPPKVKRSTKTLGQFRLQQSEKSDNMLMRGKDGPNLTKSVRPGSIKLGLFAPDPKPEGLAERLDAMVGPDETSDLFGSVFD